jgi:hypothetical protein
MVVACSLIFAPLPFFQKLLIVKEYLRLYPTLFIIVKRDQRSPATENFNGVFGTIPT